MRDKRVDPEVEELEAVGRKAAAPARPCKYCQTLITWEPLDDGYGNVRGMPFEAPGVRHICSEYHQAKLAEKREARPGREKALAALRALADLYPELLDQV